MRLRQLPRPEAGAAPSDDVRNLVFLANLAAQETTGDTASSTSVERVQHRLRGSVEYDTLAFALESPGEDPAGYVLLSTPLLEDRSVAEVEIILDAAHLPLPGAGFDAAGRAVLQELCAAAEGEAVRLGRRVLQTWLLHPAAETPGTGSWADVLRSRGYSLELTEIQGVVDTDTPVPAWPSGVRVEVVRNLAVPPALVPGVLDLYHRASVDVPTGGLVAEPVTWTPERLTAAARRIVSTGRDMVTVVLLDATGVIGLSEITRFPGSEPGIAEQGITVIAERARGQGHGLRLKQEALGAAARELGARRVYTSNATDNTWMIDINRRLGWRVISGGSGWQKLAG